MRTASQRLAVVAAVLAVAVVPVSAAALAVGMDAPSTGDTSEARPTSALAIASEAGVSCGRGSTAAPSGSGSAAGEARAEKTALRASTRLVFGVVDVIFWRSFPGHAIWRVAGALALDTKASLKRVWFVVERWMRC